jgi:hypothetical protein
VIDLLFPRFYVFLLQLIFMNYKIEIILLDFSLLFACLLRWPPALAS